MSAHDDYPHNMMSYEAMCNEIDRLRRWKAEAIAMSDLWDAEWERVQPCGLIGQYKQTAMADEILRLRGQAAAVNAALDQYDDRFAPLYSTFANFKAAVAKAMDQ